MLLHTCFTLLGSSLQNKVTFAQRASGKDDSWAAILDCFMVLVVS